MRPIRCLLVGMLCRFEHTRDNQLLAELHASEGLDVQLAHDGLTLAYDFSFFGLFVGFLCVENRIIF